MKVDIERILELKAELAKINQVEFSTLEFYKDGEKLEFDDRILEEWRFMGMSNVDFISSGYYLETHPIDE